MLEVSGNVKATTFIGDGSQLTNLPSTGGSWGSITGTLANQADLQTALNAKQNHSTALDAVSGINTGDETQTTILNKIATQTSGAVLTMQQGSSDAASTVKFAVKDSTGAVKASITASGTGSFGDSVSATNGARALNLCSSNAVMRVLRTDSSNAAAVELIGRATGSPDGANLTYWDLYAQPTNDSFSIRRRTNGNLNVLTALTNGNVGIGTSTPTQTLEVAGGVKVGSSGTKPVCDNTTAGDANRGTFWFTNNGTSADDTMEVCARVNSSNAWKKLW